MKNVLSVVLALSVALISGCATIKPEQAADAYIAYKTAPDAGSLLLDYLGDDEQALQEVQVPLMAFRVLYDQLENQDKPVHEFFKENPAHSFQLVENWKQLKAAVMAYSQRNGTVIPPELNAYRVRIESTYGALLEAARRNDKSATVKKYGLIILEIIAAKNGVML